MPPPLLTATTQDSLVGIIMLSLIGVLLFCATWSSLSQKYITYKRVRYNRADDPLFYWFLTVLAFGGAVMCTVAGVVFTLKLTQSTGHP
ncbi:hypothetical protein [Prosthecobacter sp.]|uniref:hypothetical protein n=1 Tax=Prosthecobacter sp. TaxID=1965333 RepID=UPI0037C935AA